MRGIVRLETTGTSVTKSAYYIPRDDAERLRINHTSGGGMPKGMVEVTEKNYIEYGLRSMSGSRRSAIFEDNN